jgi:phenylacetate-CoA ligase
MLFGKIATRKLVRRMITGVSLSYHVTARHIKDTEFATENSFKALQLEQLRCVLLRAYNHVPFYRDSFKREGVDPHHFADLSEIRDYPCLTKQIYRDNIDKLK